MDQLKDIQVPLNKIETIAVARLDEFLGLALKYLPPDKIIYFLEEARNIVANHYLTTDITSETEH